MEGYADQEGMRTDAELVIDFAVTHNFALQPCISLAHQHDEGT